MSRKRINISISEDSYEELARICKIYGFRNLCEMSAAMLSLLIRYVSDAEKRSLHRHADESIEDMFKELGNWESAPSGDPPVQRHHRTIYDLDNTK